MGVFLDAAAGLREAASASERMLVLGDKQIDSLKRMVKDAGEDLPEGTEDMLSSTRGMVDAQRALVVGLRRTADAMELLGRGQE